MITIAITSPEFRQMKGISKTGNAYDMRFQNAFAFTVDANGVLSEFPDRFEIILDKDQPPYQRGKYHLADSSLAVGREGRLEVRPRLIPVVPAAAK